MNAFFVFFVFFASAFCVGAHFRGCSSLSVDYSIPLGVDDLVMLREEVGSTELEEDVVATSETHLFVNATNESFGKQVEELFYERKLENFFIHDSKDELDVLVDLPLQKGVLIVEGLARVTRVVEQHRFDEDVDQIEIEIREQGLAPEEHSTSGEYSAGSCRDSPALEGF